MQGALEYRHRQPSYRPLNLDPIGMGFSSDLLHQFHFSQRQLQTNELSTQHNFQAGSIARWATRNRTPLHSVLNRRIELSSLYYGFLLLRQGARVLEGLVHSTIQWVDDFMLGAMCDTWKPIIAWDYGAVSDISLAKLLSPK